MAVTIVVAGTEEPPPPHRRGVMRTAIAASTQAKLGLIVLEVFVTVAVFADVLAPYPLDTRVGEVYEPPSWQHPLGLDDGGIDMLSLIIHGGRMSLIVGFSAALVAMLIGGTVGVASGYLGGRVDGVLMRITDYFLVIPDLPLAIVIAAVWGPSLSHIIIVIAILLWTGTARMVRAEVKSMRERVYVKRARMLGAGHWRIVLHHVLPQVGPLLIANTVLTVAVAIFAETALAFLGLGDPTAITWGKIIELAFLRTAVSADAWWAVVPAGLCVALVIMACFWVGQTLEDSLNPRLKVAHIAPRFFRVTGASDSKNDDGGA